MSAYLISEEVLCQILDDLEMEIYNIPISALRKILASPPAEPVAWYDPEYELSDEAVLDYEYETHCVPLFRKDFVMNTIFTCPYCGSDEVTTEHHQMVMVNTGEHYCHSMKTRDANSPAKCIQCQWEGHRKDLKEDAP